VLAESVVAGFLLVCLGCFASVNLRNILKGHKKSESGKPHAEVEYPSGFIVGIVALGTFAYFAEVLLYLFLVFTDLINSPNAWFIHYQFPLMLYAQVLGIALTVIGYYLFIWSVITRGKYAVSWEMRDSHKLVTWGSYHYVRHPSYLGYFLMFFSLFGLWPNLLTLIPLIAIPGYLKVTIQEEQLLTQRFGEEYAEYKKKTGRFIPKF